MQDRAALLHAPIMALAYDFALVHQNRTDGYTALDQTLASFGYGSLEKFIHGTLLRLR